MNKKLILKNFYKILFSVFIFTFLFQKKYLFASSSQKKIISFNSEKDIVEYSFVPVSESDVNKSNYIKKYYRSHSERLKARQRKRDEDLRSLLKDIKQKKIKEEEEIQKFYDEEEKYRESKTLQLFK
ncbi:hypothetical protein [Candidatus Phytoplasma sacchari]|uniref:Uncharacterized protein n=1 Tax=Candidatus Phytoplasma sacchari TaxID=2609813 RepID=A0ABY7M2J8_9MOLU|nr:hypothetical protein O7R10_02535 [Candidatus Phytoplasma sacchari]